MSGVYDCDVNPPRLYEVHIDVEDNIVIKFPDGTQGVMPEHVAKSIANIVLGIISHREQKDKFHEKKKAQGF